MLSAKSSPEPTVGFLTVVENDEVGWLGGYLVLNLRARPVEFHCTAPIKPNRAQEILYGPTLRPFLYGEQIGATLIQKAKSKPQLIFTDTDPALAARDMIRTPLAMLWSESSRPLSGLDDDGPSYHLDAVHSANARRPHWVSIQLGNNEIKLQSRHVEDEALIVRRWSEMQLQLDLSEPFERLHQALAEAHQDS